MIKFQTTNSKLFDNNNENVIPEWMESLSEKTFNENTNKIDLEIEKKGAFAESMKVQRPQCTASPRDLISNFNEDKVVLDSKTELAKFLRGKYYKTNHEINGNTVILHATIDGVQANFVFNYTFSDGKLNNNPTFLVNDQKYPYSYSGLEECLSDLKSGVLQKSKSTIASTRKTYVINREEIVRRFNGHLRDATDSINEKLKNGDIVGVGSNSYASFYDPDELFPQIEKEKPEDVNGSFEFVDNTEHVETNEFKSAKKLSFVAGKLISKIFADYIINDSKRNNNTLIVNATVLNSKTNIRHNVLFNFDIYNENISSIKNATINNTTFTVEELINNLNSRNNLVASYLKTQTASKRIHAGGVLTRREIHSQLETIVNKELIEDFINSWLELKLIKQVGNDEFTTEKTFPELLDVIVAESLSSEEQNKIKELKKKFGEGLDFDRIEQKDTGVRESEDIELSDELKLSVINSELTKKFKNYQIVSFDNNNVNAVFVNNGVRYKVTLSAEFDGRKLEKLSAIIKNKQVNLDNLFKAFSVNPLLKDYIQNNEMNVHSSNIIASENNLLNRLQQLVENPKDVLDEWKNKYLKNIGSKLYSSEYTFEELLNKTNALPLSNESKQQMLTAKQYFGNKFVRVAQDDTGIRDLEYSPTEENLIYLSNNFLSKHFNNYKAKDFSCNGNNAKYFIELFDDSTGLSCIVEFDLKFLNNKVLSCNAILNNEVVSLENIKNVFAMNEVLSKYLQSNSSKKFNVPMIITKSDLFRRLSKISNVSKEDIELLVKNWELSNKVTVLSDNLIASDNTLEKLISESNIKALTDGEIVARLDKSRRDKMLTIKSCYIEDSDTRQPEVVLSSAAMAMHARSSINSMFADFDILDANLIGNNYNITARIINPINGLRKVLSFEFETNNGKKIGEIKTVSDGSKTVDINDILTLLETNNEAVNKLIEINSNEVSNRQYETIFTKSSLKSKLLPFVGINNIDVLIDTLVNDGIIQQIESEKFVSEFSLTNIVEYLCNAGKLDIEGAEKELSNHNKDTVVRTDSPVVMDCDNRTISKPEDKLSPKMLNAIDKIRKIVVNAKNSETITNNKFNYFTSELNNCKNVNDVDKIWKEISIYLKRK